MAIDIKLLHTSNLDVEEFFGDDIPPYATLSHTWGKEEVTFQDMNSSDKEQKEGYAKLKGCCERAVRDGYDFVWIDTCCIDKTSSAELLEAINSMYKRYQKADVCYAYLADVTPLDAQAIKYDCERKIPHNNFSNCKWFSGGWTLQELIAPSVVEFYAADWSEIGTKSRLRIELADITGINICVVDGEDPFICNVGERLSWAASRERPESTMLHTPFSDSSKSICHFYTKKVDRHWCDCRSRY